MRALFKYLLIIIFTSCKTSDPQVTPSIEEGKQSPKIKKNIKYKSEIMLAVAKIK
tara:strand:- start:396 stop:560 length:165 start_codon:yes stop_codon:yes gene_type:complete